MEGILVTKFYSPIGNLQGHAPIKYIPLFTLRTFQGMIIEDPDTFMLEIYVICRSYYYTTNEHKIKLFPSTLKGEILSSFIALSKASINS